MDYLLIPPTLAIPKTELLFTACRASGPGGQHVNTTSSQVILHFDIQNSPTLSTTQKIRITEELSRYIDKKGVLSLRCSERRSQLANKESCYKRLQNLLLTALAPRKVRRATRPGKAAHARRLENKRHKSDTKKLRKKVFSTD